jgi:hypothetical protein
MTLGRIFALIGVALLITITNVAVSVLYMVLYGHVIDPGHDPKYYEDHVQVAAPYCSIVAGIPLMFFAGWWVAGWWQRTLRYRGAILVWLTYAIIDITVVLMAGMTLEVFLLVATSFLTKLAAVYWGASVRLKSPVKLSVPLTSAAGG